MSNTHGQFIWTELMTPDMEAAGRFYGHVVGWQLKDFSSEDMAYTVFEAEGRGVGGMMELTNEHTSVGIPPNWTRYVEVEDVDRTAKLYEEKGGRIMRPPQDIPGIGRFAVVADPHGAVLCIMTPLPVETDCAPQDTGTLTGHVGWNELFTDNVDEAMHFYGEVFGWTKDHDVDMGDMGPYRIFAHNGNAIGGMMKRMPQMPVCHWGHYFNVDGLDDALIRVTTGGGKVDHGPVEVPGNSWIANCQDPQGAYFSLVSTRK